MKTLILVAIFCATAGLRTRCLPRTAALVAALAALAACSTFPTQEYNKDANAAVHVIAIAPIGMPDEPQVTIVNAVGNSFGLIGALVEASRASNASKEAATALQTGNFAYKTYLPVEIDNGLKADGFQTIVLPGTRTGADAQKFLATLPPATGADAVLDIYVTYIGYVAAGATTPYHPAVHIQAQLTDLKTNKVLFADQVFYNNFLPKQAKKAISIEPDPKFAFADRAAMVAAPGDVSKDLREACGAVAAELARQFR